MQRRAAAFTLIEMLVVLSLLGILMGLSIGLIQKAGTGNQLALTTNALVSQLATVRAQAIGDDAAYLVVEPAGEDGGPVAFRNYRNRQVFHWPCEDLTSASERDVMEVTGAVTIASGPVPSLEGQHAVFGAGARVNLGKPPWLEMRDGFSIRCRLRVDPEAAQGSMDLVRKGDGLRILVVRGDEGRFDVQCRMRLEADERGESGGDVELKTGRQGDKLIPEWGGPLIPGRWHDVQVVYDRNDFEILVDGMTRARRTDLDNGMRPDLEADFILGGGYQGGFDSLVIGGIFEDDDDFFEVPVAVSWIDAEGNPVAEPRSIHYRNRGLDPRYHSGPPELRFRLERGEEQRSAVRVVRVAMSGEPFVERSGE